MSYSPREVLQVHWDFLRHMQLLFAHRVEHIILRTTTSSGHVFTPPFIVYIIHSDSRLLNVSATVPTSTITSGILPHHKIQSRIAAAQVISDMKSSTWQRNGMQYIKRNHRLDSAWWMHGKWRMIDQKRFSMGIIGFVMIHTGTGGGFGLLDPWWGKLKVATL